MMQRSYVLTDRGSPVREADANVWGRWVKTHDRMLLCSTVPDRGIINTVFLAYDINEEYGHPPVLYITTVFGGALHNREWRWGTRQEATQGHWSVVRQVEVVPGSGLFL